MYGAAFASMFSGSMYGSGPVVFSVWLYAIACSDKTGTLDLNPKMLAPMIGCEVKDVVEALDYLTSEDPDSRSIKEDGCRLVREGQYQYRMVNKRDYTELKSYEDKKNYDRRYRAEERANQVTVVDSRKQSSTVVDARDESEKIVHVDVDVDVDVLGDEEEATTTVGVSTTRIRAREDSAFINGVLESWGEHQIVPSVQAMSSQRRSTILARRNEHSGKAVYSVIEKRAASNFLTHQFNDGRGAPIDWCMGPKNFVKILDGNFDDGGDGADYGGTVSAHADKWDADGNPL